MNKLPQEIHCQIFCHLCSKDKSNCLHVSKDWNSWVKRCLFRDIVIQDSATLTNVITYFRKYKDDAKHVLNLEISNFADVYTYTPYFQQVFSNLKTISLKAACRIYAFRGQLIETGTWNSLQKIITIEYMYNVGPLLVELVLYNYCPNVTELSTGFPEIPTRHNSFICVLSSSLKNTPQLAKLCLRSVHCTTSDLENLHRNSPNLKILSLVDCLFSVSAIDYTEPTYLDSLSISLDSDSDVESALTFIVKKYRGLTRISIKVGTAGYTYNRLDEQVILPLFANCPHLFHYDQTIYLLTKTITYEMDSCGIQLQEIVLYANNGTVNSQFSALVISNQRQSLSSVKVITVDDNSLEDERRWNERVSTEEAALKYLKLMNSVTKLSFEASDKEPICLTMLMECLNDMPQLLNISLHNVCIRPKEIPTSSMPLQVKSIEISMLEIPCLENLESVNLIMQNLLPRCPELEHFKLMTDIRSISWGSYTSVFTMVLDFSCLDQLKSIDVNLKRNKSQYFLVQKGSGASGYFFFNGNRLDRIDSIPQKHYYTTILLSRTVLLNSVIV